MYARTYRNYAEPSDVVVVIPCRVKLKTITRFKRTVSAGPEFKIYYGRYRGLRITDSLFMWRSMHSEK